MISAQAAASTAAIFDGDAGYEPARDNARLAGQLRKVWQLMLDGQWRTLPDIAAVCDGSEASISARLRDLRKLRFGGYIVNRRYLGNGLYEYQVQPGVPTLDAIKAAGLNSDDHSRRLLRMHQEQEHMELALCGFSDSEGGEV